MTTKAKLRNSCIFSLVLGLFHAGTPVILCAVKDFVVIREHAALKQPTFNRWDAAWVEVSPFQPHQLFTIGLYET